MFRRRLLARLLFPLLRGKHPPEHAAWGSFVGIFAALTPTVGIQMVAILAVWLAVRKLAGQSGFSLVVALAWTWTSNVFTIPFLYYAFFMTGQVLAGNWSHLIGYDDFVRDLTRLLAGDEGLTAIGTQLLALWHSYGVPLFVGCLPWALLCAWLGYRWSYRLIATFRARQARKSRLPSVQSPEASAAGHAPPG